MTHIAFSRENMLLVVIIGLSLFLRLSNLEYMEFKGDQAFNSLKAIELAREGVFPLTSAVSSTGINEPPIFMYLLALPYLFSTDPVAAAGYVAVLNVIGIFLCFILVRKLYGSSAAIISSLLYAVSPWQIFFSRIIWTQCLLAPFVLLFLYFVHGAIYEHRKRWIAYSLVLLGLVLQLHLSAGYFALVMLVLMVYKWKDLDKRYLAVGVSLFIATFVPYFIYQLEHDFVDVKKMSSVVQKDTGITSQAVKRHFTLITTNGFNYSLGESSTEFGTHFIKFAAFDYASAALLALSIVTICIIWQKESLLLLSWLILGTLYLTLTKSRLRYHYFISFFPLYFILIGSFVSWVLSKKNTLLKPALLGLVGILAVYQATFDLSFLQFIKQTERVRGDYGIPYAYLVKQVRSAVDTYGFPKTRSGREKLHEKVCETAACTRLTTNFVLKRIRCEAHGGGYRAFRSPATTKGKV